MRTITVLSTEEVAMSIHLWSTGKWSLRMIARAYDVGVKSLNLRMNKFIEIYSGCAYLGGPHERWYLRVGRKTAANRALYRWWRGTRHRVDGIFIDKPRLRVLFPRS